MKTFLPALCIIYRLETAGLAVLRSLGFQGSCEFLLQFSDTPFSAGPKKLPGDT